MGHSRTWLAFALAFTPGAQASAQSVARLVVAGDSAYAARRAPDALKDYLAALRRNSTDANALWRASRTEAELAVFNADSVQVDTLLHSAERHGRAAVALAPGDPQGHFALAQALGRIALRTPVMERLPYAVEVHQEALACLALDNRHPGCLHILGLWDAQYQMLGFASRQLADVMTGGKLFTQATWEEAERNLYAAIEHDPQRTIHHWDLARIYQVQGKADSARTEFQTVLKCPLQMYNDAGYQAAARAALDSLGATGVASPPQR